MIRWRRRFPVSASQLRALADEDAFGLGAIISPRFRSIPRPVAGPPADPGTPRRRLAAEIVRRVRAYAQGGSPRPVLLLSKPSGSGKSHLLLTAAAAAEQLGLPSVDLRWQEQVKAVPPQGPWDDWLARTLDALRLLARDGRLVCLDDELAWRYPQPACHLLLESLAARYYCLVAAHKAEDEVGSERCAYDIFDLDRDYALSCAELESVVRDALDEVGVPEAVFPRALVARVARGARYPGRALGIVSGSIGQAAARARERGGPPVATPGDVRFWLRVVDHRPYREWLKTT